MESFCKGSIVVETKHRKKTKNKSKKKPKPKKNDKADNIEESRVSVSL